MQERDILINEIIEQDPHIIVVKGNTNPTYASCSFSHILTYTGINWVEFCGAQPAENDDNKFNAISTSRTEWLTDIIKHFEEYHKLTIFKFNNGYYIFHMLYNNESIQDYILIDDKGNEYLALDGGGVIEFI